MTTKSKILLFDIETSLMEVYAFRVGDQFIGIEDIKKDWHLMAFAAKWLGEKEVIYCDQRNSKPVSNDKSLAKKLRDLINEADVLVSQNGIRFDLPKLNARLEQNDLEIPKPVRHVDVLKIKRKVYGFTSNKLAYTSSVLNKTYKKLSHNKFPGKELWKECAKGNLSAWKEMELYNIHDVLSLEEEYLRLAPKDAAVDRSTGFGNCRVCDGSSFKKNGLKITATGKFQQYQCLGCGAWMRGGTNLLSKEEKREIKRKI